MGIRDEEIKRLILYAKGLGVNVTVYQKASTGNAAEWTIDGTQINIFNGASKSKTDMILDLIHEIGHHAWFIHEKARQVDMKFDEAITRQNLFAEDSDNPTPKHLRKKILDVEAAGTKYWDVIYKDTNIKIPLWKLEASKEFDIWMYEMYYETGEFPKGLSKRQRHAEIFQKHKARG